MTAPVTTVVTMAKTGSGIPKARGGSSRTPTIAAVAVLVILAAVVFGGVFWSRSNRPDPTAAPIAPAPVPATYSTSVQDNVVVAGSGPRVVDLYEDAQCPACKRFEELYGDRIVNALNANRVTVRYHMVNLLDSQSTPPGYSTLGGNAIMCAAQENAFPAVHNTLYARQPPEGGSGFTTGQLVDLGRAVGAGPGYASCVQNGTYSAGVAQNFQRAQSDPALEQNSGGSRGFGTPTVQLDGTTVDPGDPGLDAALG